MCGHLVTIAGRRLTDQAASEVMSSFTVGRAVTITVPPQFQHDGSASGSRPSTSHALHNQCAMTCMLTAASSRTTGEVSMT